MSEMIERVAKAVAIFEACRGNDGVLCKWEKCHCKNIARAAIEAMSDPTFEMRKVGNLALNQSDNIAATWQSMINAALNIQPTNKQIESGADFSDLK